jgi:hypothetical protein
MAFTLEEQARLLLDPRMWVRRNDAAGFTSCCGLVSRSVPLRTPPLDDARGPHYRGPWRLPGPDSHRLAALSFSLGYVTTTSSSSWRPNCWTHSATAGYPGDRNARRRGRCSRSQALPQLCLRPRVQQERRGHPSRELAGPDRMTRPNDVDEAGSARPERHVGRRRSRRRRLVAAIVVDRPMRLVAC